MLVILEGFGANFAAGVSLGMGVMGLVLLASWYMDTRAAKSAPSSAKESKVRASASQPSTLGVGESSAAVVKSASSGEEAGAPLLDRKLYKAFPIEEIIERSHNVKQFRVKLPAGRSLGIPVGTHVSIAPAEGARAKPYTPISTDRAVGYFDLLVKVYEGGRVSTALHAKSVGEDMYVRGPVGKHRYEAPADGVRRDYGLVAGGSGITPMLQMIHAIIEDPEDSTNVSLLFANRTQSDILLREELSAISEENGDQINVHHVLSREPEDSDWNGLRGHIGQEILARHMPMPLAEGEEGREVGVFLCGPSAFCKAMKEHLLALGYPTSAIHKF